MPSSSKGGAKKKPEFTRCPHCPRRYGSEETLVAHVEEHRQQYRDQMLRPEHKALIDPVRHHVELRKILKRHGHG